MEASQGRYWYRVMVGKKFVTVLIFISIPQIVWALNPTEICDQLIAKLTSVKRDVCLNLFQTIPNKDGLEYSLRYLTANYGGFKDDKCLKRSIVNINERSRVPPADKRTIQNGCTFVLNNTLEAADCLPDEKNAWRCQGRGAVKKYAGRSQGYFINLCATDPASALIKFPINRGTATTSPRPGEPANADILKRNTTILGAFMTGTPTRGRDDHFNSDDPGTVERYRAYKRDPQNAEAFRPPNDRYLRLELYGLHSTNTETAFRKPMHTTPFYSSGGCPSLPHNRQSADIIRNLGRNGPSLIINYGRPEQHPIASINNCGTLATPQQPRRVNPAEPRRRHRRGQS